MFARMENIKMGNLDEEGKSINDVEKALARVDIKLRINSTTFRNMSDVIDDVAKKWKTLNAVEQSSIAQAIAGQRQRENFLVLMNNYSQALEFQATEADSAGLAMRRYEIYLDSIEAASNRLTTAWQKMWQETISQEGVKGFINSIASIENFVGKIGGLQPVLLFVVSLLAAFNAQLIANNVGKSVKGIFDLINAYRTLGSVAMSTGAMITLGLGAVVAIGTVIYAVVKGSQKSVEDLNNELDTMQMKITETAQAIDKIKRGQKALTDLGKRYDELRSKNQKSNKELQEWTDLQNQIKTILPEVNGQYNEMGDFIIADNLALADLIALQKELLEIQQKQMQVQLFQKATKDTEAFKKSLEDVKKSQSKLENYQNLSNIYGNQEGGEDQLRQLNGMTMDDLKKRIIEAQEEVKANQTISDSFVNNLKAEWSSMTKENQDQLINWLGTMGDAGQKVTSILQNVGSEAATASGAATDALTGDDGVETEDKAVSFQDEIDGMNAKVKAYQDLTDAMDTYGENSSEVYSALQELIGKDADINKYLTEEGKVDMDSLNGYLDDFYMQILDYADKIERTSPGMAAALRNLVTQATSSMQEMKVQGFDMTQATYQNFANSISDTLYKVATDANIQVTDINGNLLTSADAVKTALINNFYNYKWLLDQFKAAGIATLADLMKYLSGQAAFATGTTPYQPTYSPTSGGGGGGGSPSNPQDDAEKARIQAETNALEEKKKALQDQLDLYKQWIDAQKKALEVQKETKEFTEDLLEKETDLAKLKAQIALYDLDESEEAQSKKIDLEEQASELEKDIEKSKEDRIYDLKTQALDDAESQYEDYINRKIAAIDRSIDAVKAETDAIKATTKSVQGTTVAQQQNGIVTQAVAAQLIAHFQTENKLSAEALLKLQEMAKKWVEQKVLIRDALDQLERYRDTLSTINLFVPTTAENRNGGKKTFKEHQGGLIESHHQGDFAGGLRSNEVFAKLLKGEYVATEAQMNRFLMSTLPSIMKGTPTTNGAGGVNVTMPITVEGNLDKTVIPDIKKIVKQVIEEINKSIAMRGNLRTANQTIS